MKPLLFRVLIYLVLIPLAFFALVPNSFETLRLVATGQIPLAEIATSAFKSDDKGQQQHLKAELTEPCVRRRAAGNAGSYWQAQTDCAKAPPDTGYFQLTTTPAQFEGILKSAAQSGHINLPLPDGTILAFRVVQVPEPPPPPNVRMAPSMSFQIEAVHPSIAGNGKLKWIVDAMFVTASISIPGAAGSSHDYVLETRRGWGSGDTEYVAQYKARPPSR